MEFGDIERLFYNESKSFRGSRTPEENEMTQSTAENEEVGMQFEIL